MEKQTIFERLKCSKLPKWFYVASIGSIVILTLLLILIFFIYKDVNVWQSMTPARELTSPDYHEHIHESSIFRTRFNTWSNLAFVYAGIFMLCLALYDMKKKFSLKQGYIVATPFQTIFVALTFIYLGLGSGFFHASLTRFGQQCDVGGMYAASLSLVLVSLGSWIPYITSNSKKIMTWPFIVSAGVLGSILMTVYKWSLSSGKLLPLFIVSLVIFIVADLFHKTRKLQIRWFLFALISLGAGIAFRTADVDFGYWPGHSIWHVLLAMYIGFIYLYHRSEIRTK